MLEGFGFRYLVIVREDYKVGVFRLGQPSHDLIALPYPSFFEIVALKPFQTNMDNLVFELIKAVTVLIIVHGLLDTIEPFFGFNDHKVVHHFGKLMKPDFKKFKTVIECEAVVNHELKISIRCLQE